MKIEELIAKLEEASGPDRELDSLIYRAIREPGWTTDEEYTPLYTAALDAALTLVPEGWQWQASNRAPAPHKGRAYINNGELINAGVGGMRRNPKYRGHETTAATATLAMCVVCLRARTAEGAP